MRKNYLRKKFNRKRKNTFKIFFLVIVGMTVGFAALNTTLQLIGTLNISRTTWNIHWANPTKVGGVTATKDATLKTGDNTTVEYEVNLANRGDYYEFTIDGSTYSEFFISQEQYIIIYCNPNNHNDCTNKNPATLKKSYIKYAWISGLIPVITIPALLIVNKLKKHK